MVKVIIRHFQLELHIFLRVRIRDFKINLYSTEKKLNICATHSNNSILNSNINRAISSASPPLIK